MYETICSFIFMNFWTRYHNPVIALAPMAGYSDIAFRHLVRSLDPNILLISEMVSIEALVRGSEKTSQIYEFEPRQKPFIVQLFGNNPENFAKVAKILDQEDIDGIDINMGCPAPKIIKSGYGSELMRAPELAAECVQALAQNSRHPVSIKTRMGYQERDIDKLLKFAEGIHKAGAQAISLHGRTFKQAFRGLADWEHIYQVKEAIPTLKVVGNGDINSLEVALQRLFGRSDIDMNLSYLQMLDAYGPPKLDGLMIGRAVIANPWLLQEICRFIYSGEHIDSESIAFTDKLSLIQEHIAKLIESKGEKIALQEIRKFLLMYTRGLVGAKEMRNNLAQLDSPEKIKHLLENLSTLQDT
jgi:tRNA-dihydrouridine synthase B